MRRVLLFASVPDGAKAYPRAEIHRETSRPVLIRDAVLAVVREGLDRDLDFVFGAHPSISPMVLTVAREFPTRTPPRIVVFESLYFDPELPPESLELADGRLGRREPIAAVPGDRDASLRAMRKEMVSTADLIGAVVIGGMDGVTEEAKMFLNWHQRALPLYAFGSTGGAARDLFDASPPGFYESDFCGGRAQLPRDLLYDPVPGYARVARAIFDVMLSPRG